MSTELVPFTFEGEQVRTFTVDGEPVFVGKDSCDVLGISKYRDALAQLDDDERVSVTVDTPGGPQQMVAVTEPGIYALMLISRSPKVRAFRRWVTHDVIPQIRKTGRYEASPATIEVPLGDYERLLTGGQQLLTKLRSQQKELEATTARNIELEPAANAWEVLASGNGDYSVNDAAKVLSRDPSIQLGERRLFTLLNELGWIYRQQIDQRWRAYQKAIDNGRLSLLPQSHYHPRTAELIIDPPQIRVTVKGVQYLHQHLGGTAQLRLDLGRAS